MIIEGESRTFSEYLLLPNLTTKRCVPENVTLKTALTKHQVGEVPSHELNIPVASAIMQAVSDQRMAIAMARHGGISFLYGSQPVEQQAAMVRAVKAHKAGFVVSDANVTPDSKIRDVIEITNTTGHSTVAVTEDGSSSGKLVGIITDKDYRLSRVDFDAPARDLMTPLARLICGEKNIRLEEANDLIWKHKINCLPIIDSGKRLVNLVFRKDYEDHKSNPLELLDSRKRLMVGAGINTRDHTKRVPALVEAGVDVLCVDSSDGYTEWQADTIKFIRDTYGDTVKVGGGNVVDREGFEFLVESGADFVKVGIGGGAICITREQKGIGRGQASALLEVVQQRDAYLRNSGVYIPICSDGGIFQDYHIGLALAMGADFVMMGRYFARLEESPSRFLTIDGIPVKEYWGEGTERAGNWARYDTGNNRQLQFEEGVDAYVPYGGSLSDALNNTLAKLKSMMVSCGATSLSELQESARITVVSQSSIREGALHDIILKSKNLDS